MEIYNKIISPVIEELVDDYSKEKNIKRDDVYKKIRKAIDETISEYYTKRTPKINYSDFIVRIGYLHCLVNGLTYTYKNIIEKALDIGCFIEKDIKIIVFGGGPGTELLAASMMLRGKNINFCLTDKNKSWADCWNLLRERVLKELQNSQTSINCDFLPIDITDLNEFSENKIRLCENKYFFISYVISELYDKSHYFEDFLRKIIEYKKNKESIILLADRDEIKIKQKIKDLKENLSLEEKFCESFEIKIPENYNKKLEPIKKLGPPKISPFKSIQCIFESNWFPF